MIIIKVFHDNRPVKNAKVHLDISGFLGVLFNSTPPQFTDINGEAAFDHDPADGWVYVNGRKVRGGMMEGTVIVRI
jgi:uncharacterized GH25 family protein